MPKVSGHLWTGARRLIVSGEAGAGEHGWFLGDARAFDISGQNALADFSCFD